MSTQVKHHTSICHIVSQNKIKTMQNLAKLCDRSVQT
jgi:DeoR/GlpR family transcriptional regulator of sugar metabolism